MSRGLRWLLLGVLLLAALLATLATWLLYSEGGARLALRALGSRTPQLATESVSGGLAGPLSVRGLRFENAQLLLEIDRAELTWAPAALLAGRLLVQSLDAGTVRLTLKPSTAPPPTEPGDLVTQLPLGLDLARVTAAALVLQLPEAAEQRIEALDLSARWFGESVVIRHLRLRRPEVGDVALAGEARLEPRGLELHGLRIAAPVQLEVSGHVAYDADSELDLSWQALQWPFEGEPQVSSAQGRAHLSGRPDAWRAQLDAALVAQGIDGTLSARLFGNQARAEIEEAQLHALEGTLSARGLAEWSPQLRLEAEGTLRGVDPAVRWPQWPGAIDADVAVRTTLADDAAPRVQFEARTRASRLRNYRFGAVVEGSWQDGALAFTTAELSSGRSRLRAQGQVLPTLDLEADLRSPSLSELAPELAGRAELRAQLRGLPQRPQGDVRGRLDALAWGTTTLESAALDARIDLDADSRVSLELRGLHAGRPIERVDLLLEGPVDAHRVELSAAAGGSTARITAQGALDVDALRWDGRLETGAIAPAGLDGWTLEEPSTLSASASAVDLAPACWRSADARACARFLRDAQATRVALRMENFAFAYFRALFPPEWTLTGSVSGAGTVDFAGNGIADLSADFATTAGAWSAGGRTLLEFRPGRLQALDTAGGGMQLLLDVPFAQGGARLDAQLGAGADFMQRALGGTLQLSIPDLAFVRAFSTEIESAQGKVQGELRLSGTPAAPVANGRIALADGRVRLVTPGIEIAQLAAQVEGSSQAGRLQFSAQGQSGGGEVRLEGTLDTAAEGGRTAQLSLRGKDFQAAKTPDARIWISPDLALRYDAAGLQLTGTVGVPRAEITPQRFDRGVSASRDQIIVGEDDVAGPREEPVSLTSEVEVQLGDDVRFDGFGLKTQLTGAVRVFDQPGRITSGRGELRLVGGHYKAYGQDLAIESGRLIFAGGAVTDPAVEIRAVRKPREDITVGVFVRGTLDRPLFNLYSTPAMPQERQLSWLVLGRSLDETGADADDRGLLANAALSLGLSGSDYLANRFGGKLGIDEISIGAQPGESNDQARLTIGKYLSPKLFVSYGLGLFQPGHTFRLRYDIGRGFKLQTETGVESGGDLLYTIER